MSRILPRRASSVWLCMLLAVVSASAGEQAWHAAEAPLMTRWAAAVNATNAWPEYPRPQLVRNEWLNLNGLWDYAVSVSSAVEPPPAQGNILVPFPLESALSGVMTNLDEHSKLWYRRVVSVPLAWRGRRVRLHFGAVDWHAQVSVNGHELGSHQGGYDPFTFDITDALRWNGAEDVTVCVTDPTEGDQPRGKQSRRPEGIFYSSVSGIWQTVWLEPVPATCIDGLKIVPDPDTGSVRLRVAVNSLAEDLQIEAVASAHGKVVGRAIGSPNTELVLRVAHPHLWSPDDPFLYDLAVTLRGGQSQDAVSSYFGLRKVALRKDAQGVTRIALNDQFLFEVGTLDQGFWPDGIYTAPSDEALRSDIEFLKAAGFNLTRKHVKVEPDRWYYWCDKLGLLVWQDMPSANNATAEGRRNFESELVRMLDNLQNHPAIITWVLFNEGWGQYDTESLTRWVKSMDPSRLVDDASGWTDMRVGDLIDMHSYPGPDAPTLDPRRAAVLGEFGGLGLVIDGHSWSTRHWGYVMLADQRELEGRYRRALEEVWRSHALRGLSAAIYTQTTDVETECNGLLTYDRRVAKIPLRVLAAANHSGAPPPAKVILPDALFGGATWKYTMDEPPAHWHAPDFVPAGWREGLSGFGSAATPGILLHTTWTSGDIWLRTQFFLTPEELSGLRLELFHDEDAEIYLNGVLALKVPGFITDYDQFEISREALAALHPGTNSIAAHCHQTTGGQGVDIGLIIPQKSGH
ncbi:MAG TPA: glycoside hydrolase family 2 TIM barrel-domain containing protein [Verrucomicrobiae bacterium]|nr:glycoside hydrolase family 2 TIM barrel-domain containing protein [Verrucomicrobiae bacterium]